MQENADQNNSKDGHFLLSTSEDESCHNNLYIVSFRSYTSKSDVIILEEDFVFYSSAWKFLKAFGASFKLK